MKAEAQVIAKQKLIMTEQRSFLIIFYSWPAQLENFKNVQSQLHNVNSDIFVYLDEEQFDFQRFFLQGKTAEDFLDGDGHKHFKSQWRLAALIVGWIFKNRSSKRYIYFHGEVWGNLTLIPCILAKITRSSIIYLNARVDLLQPLSQDSAWNRLKRRFGRSALIRKFVINSADYVLQISPASSSFLSQLGVSNTKVCHIPLPCSDPRTVEVNWDHHFQEQLTSSDINLVFIGRASYQKGLDILSRAFETLSQQFNCTLTIFGPTESEINEEMYISKENLEHVFVAGAKHRDQIYSFSARYHCIVVVPSRHQHNLLEQFGMVVAESLASGLRVVCSTAGALRYTGADHVIRYSRDDPVALATAIIEARSLPKVDPTRRAFFQRNYSEKAASQSFERLFSLLENKNTTPVN